MANYREHITVSTLLGIGYGAGAFVGFGFTPVQGMLSACLTGLAGMLPDLDSDNGRPVREMFGLLGAVAPLLLVNRVIAFLGLPGDPEVVMLVIVFLYVAIKYGGAEFIRRVSVHRGMFHSLPALLISAEAVYLAYPGPRPAVRALMAGGVALGFLSHLLLDELYSVHLKDSKLQLKKSSGTALKWSGEKLLANVVAYTLMTTLTYAVLYESGWFEQAPISNGSPLAVPDGERSAGTENDHALQMTTDLGAPQPLAPTADAPHSPLPQAAQRPELNPWPR